MISTHIESQEYNTFKSMFHVGNYSEVFLPKVNITYCFIFAGELNSALPTVTSVRIFTS